MLGTKTILVAALSAGFAMTCPVSAGTVAYLDFGNPSIGTGNAGGVQYNDVGIDGNADGVNGLAALEVNGALGTTLPAPLVDTSNAATGWSLQAKSLNDAGNLADNGTGGSSVFSGPYPAAVSGIETSALRSMWFFNRGKDIQLTFSGLNDNATYDLLLFGGSQQVGTDTNSIVRGVGVTGSGVDFTPKTMNTWLNDSDVIQWSGIAPDGGVIAFNLESGREGWLNFMSIEESVAIPEPAALSVGMLGIAGLCLRRRRSA